MTEASAQGAHALRLTDLDDAEASNRAAVRRHGRRAITAVVLGGIFGTFAGEVGPQAYSIAAAFVAWGALSGTRVVKAMRLIRAAREERNTLLGRPDPPPKEIGTPHGTGRP